jgi:deoxyribodipyrimidine photo-lyase
VTGSVAGRTETAAIRLRTLAERDVRSCPVSTAVVLFTRDLRVHDHPALHAACREADRVLPLFVFDDAILASRYAAPNRVAGLLDALEDLRGSIAERGGRLHLRRGDVVEQVRVVLEGTGADQLHLSDDVSAYARRRLAALRELGDELGVRVEPHPGVLLVDPAEVQPSGGDHFRVFTPYFRRWVDRPFREPLPAPDTIASPDDLDGGTLPAREDLVTGEEAPERLRTGESVARERLDVWFDGGIEDYDDGRDELSVDGTSRFSPHLHLGCLSTAEIVDRVDRRRQGHDAFLRQLCWREFNHQLLAANPELPRRDLRTQGDRWREDDEALEAWKAGRTGYPIVDAGMRQLRREGWMHNRARLLTASFLTKHLYLDWRLGAWHFMDHLVDGDLADNFGQWQWVAGTGTDSRPNRMFNPTTQAQRYDPAGGYVRRYVPELADADDRLVHTPWEADAQLFRELDYPAPIVDHHEARERFLSARGR